MFGKFWNNILQTNQEYAASYVSNCKPRCPKRFTTTFTPEHSMSLPWVVGSSEVVPPTQQCTPTYSIFHQRIVVSTLNHCIAAWAKFSRFVTLWFFLIPMTERPTLCWHSGHSNSHDKQLCSISESTFQDFFQRPPEILEAMYWCRRRHRSVNTLYSFLCRQSRYFVAIGCNYNINLITNAENV